MNDYFEHPRPAVLNIERTVAAHPAQKSVFPWEGRGRELDPLQVDEGLRRAQGPEVFTSLSDSDEFWPQGADTPQREASVAQKPCPGAELPTPCAERTSFDQRGERLSDAEAREYHPDRPPVGWGREGPEPHI